MGIRIESLCDVSMGSKAGQLRAVPVNLGDGAARAFLATYCADFDVDPYVGMFFFPTDTPKMVLFTEEGEILWRRDLGRGVVPGMWFLPVLAFDLDGDGVDEIWFVNNTDTQHPLHLAEYKIERLDASTGKTTGQWKWPHGQEKGRMSASFRNFFAGGHAKDEPILLTAQGTYDLMTLQGWNVDMTQRWETVIEADSPGARGSHMCAISDLDCDGIQEILWGERCIRLSDGAELFCADRDTYRGHSDVAQPVLDRETGRWYVYVCRESDHNASPRVLLYDDKGERVWSDVDHGHMDMGWTAHLGPGGGLVSMAIRIGHKTCGPDGRFHEDCEEFTYDTLTGQPEPLSFSIYGTIPVDLNGDGRHELVRGRPGNNGEIIDGEGYVLGNTTGTVAMAAKLVDHPGEQLLVYRDDGTVSILADRNAEDSDTARKRYEHPIYRANRRLTSTGSNLIAVAGI